jgi:ribosome-binding protein aMBF1 (putative translation factor)
MTREDREAAGLRIEDMAALLKIPVNDLCLYEMHATKYSLLLAEALEKLPPKDHATHP